MCKGCENLGNKNRKPVVFIMFLHFVHNLKPVSASGTKKRIDNLLILRILGRYLGKSFCDRSTPTNSFFSMRFPCVSLASFGFRHCTPMLVLVNLVLVNLFGFWSQLFTNKLILHGNSWKLTLQASRTFVNRPGPP